MTDINDFYRLFRSNIELVEHMIDFDLSKQLIDLAKKVYNIDGRQDLGIVPCFIMIVYSIIYFKNMVAVLKAKDISEGFRILSLGVFICIALQMFFEPIMTGSSLFLIVSIIIGALFERLIISEE